MKAYLLTLGAAALLALPATAQLAALTNRPAPMGARALTPDEQLFTGLIEQLGTNIGKHDMTALGQLMAPEFVHYNPGNSSSDRSEELAYLATWPPTTMKLVGPVKVNRYGNTAITVSTSTFGGVDNGKPFSNTYQMMIAWVLRDGKWQMVVVQSKPMPT